MVTTATGTDVKNNLAALKKAVSALTKADKAWLAALETFLEGRDPNDSQQFTVNGDLALVITSVLPAGLTNVKSSDLLPFDQAVRLLLDELSLLQLADRKLGGKVPQVDVTPDGLGTALKEAEAYLVLTNEAFQTLSASCTGFKDITDFDDTFTVDFQANLIQLTNNANATRNGGKVSGQTLIGLGPQVAKILQSGGAEQITMVTIAGGEPEGTDLLLGKGLNTCDEAFMALMPVGAKETRETQTLLSGGRLTLSDSQINALTNSWSKVVKQAAAEVGDATAATPLSIADLFCIHTTLETLYDRLETNVTRTDIDIVSLEI